MGKIVQLLVIAALIAVLQCLPIEENTSSTTEIHVPHLSEHQHQHHKDNSEESSSKESHERETRDVSHNQPQVGSSSNPSVGGPGSTYSGRAGTPSVGSSSPALGHSQSQPSVLSQPGSAYSTNNRNQQYHRQVREADSTSTSSTTESSKEKSSEEKSSEEKHSQRPGVLTATLESRHTRDTESSSSTTENSREKQSSSPAYLGQQQYKYSHNRPANVGQERHVREVSSTTESEEATTSHNHPSSVEHQRNVRDTKQQTSTASSVNKNANGKPVAQPTLFKHH